MYPDRKPKTPTVSFVLVVIPESRDLRVTIKQWGDVEEGVVTQIVRASKLHGASNQYCNNLALKINIKLGGANITTTIQSLQHILKLGTMVRYCFLQEPTCLTIPQGRRDGYFSPTSRCEVFANDLRICIEVYLLDVACSTDTTDNRSFQQMPR